MASILFWFALAFVAFVGIYLWLALLRFGWKLLTTKGEGLARLIGLVPIAIALLPVVYWLLGSPSQFMRDVDRRFLLTTQGELETLLEAREICRNYVERQIAGEAVVLAEEDIVFLQDSRISMVIETPLDQCASLLSDWRHADARRIGGGYIDRATMSALCQMTTTNWDNLPELDNGFTRQYVRTSGSIYGDLTCTSDGRIAGVRDCQDDGLCYYRRGNPLQRYERHLEAE